MEEIQHSAGQGDLPPVPASEVPCEKCACKIVLSEGNIPQCCPHCGYHLRPGTNSMWAHFCFVLRHRYITWKGRCTRKEFWSFTFISHLLLLLPTLFVYLVLNSQIPACTDAEGCIGLFIFALYFAAIAYIPLIGIPQIFLFARRLHDVGMSAIPVLVHLVLSGLLLCTVCYISFFAYFWYDEFQHLNDNAEVLQRFSSDLSFNICLVLSYIFNLGADGLKLFFLIISFINSQRGTNKYGPSRKYPLGV